LALIVFAILIVVDFTKPVQGIIVKRQPITAVLQYAAMNFCANFQHSTMRHIAKPQNVNQSSSYLSQYQ
jgi:hypothetical protein